MSTVLAWLIFAALVGMWASSKGRSGFGYFLLSVVLSPLIGAIAVAIAGDNKPAVEAEAINSGDMRKCPECAELIRSEARKCRHCGAAIEPVAA